MSHVVDLLFRDLMVCKVLKILVKCIFPCRIFDLTSICADHNILVATGFDRFKIHRKVALIFTLAEWLGEAVLQDDTVVFYQPDLIFQAHSDEPPFRMGDNNL